MTVYDALIDLIGTPPEGYEILIYIFCCCFVLFMFSALLNIISSIFNWLAGRR